MSIQISYDLSSADYVHQARATVEELLAARPFTYQKPDDDKTPVEINHYVLGNEGTVLKVVLDLLDTADKPDFGEVEAKAFLEEISDDTFCEVGITDHIYQCKLTVKELKTGSLLNNIGCNLYHGDYVLSVEGTLLKASLVLTNTDDTPEYDKDEAQAFLDYGNLYVSNDIGNEMWVYQSTLTAEEIADAITPVFYTGNGEGIDYGDVYLRTKDGQLLKARMVFLPTDDTPEFDEEAANDYLDEEELAVEDTDATNEGAETGNG